MIDDKNSRLLFEDLEYTGEDKAHWSYSTLESNKEYEARMLSNERKSFWKVFVLVNIILACLCLSEAVFGKDCSEWESLSAEQKYRLEYAYTYGKPHNLGWTMSSISWVESQAGLYKINPVSNDYGLFQINESTIYSILGVTSYWEKRKIITKVVIDDTLSAYLALDVLQHFERVHKGNWKKMVMSYNIGNNKSEKYLQRGIDYYDKVVYHLNILKKCSNFN